MFFEGKITTFFKKQSINCQKKIFELNSPKIMGILNITEDSFFDGGKYTDIKQAIQQTEHLLKEGADIIDIGACSTRPGAKLIPVKDEIDKLVPVLKAIRKEFPEIIISIDTVWSEVCKAVHDNGADIINDISGGNFDNDLLKTVGQLNMPYVLTHCPANLEFTKTNSRFKNLILEISKFFSERIEQLYYYGCKDIILDLGFGFGKTIEENYELLARQKEFEIFNLPILTGISRKSMIYKTLNTTPQEALNGTTFLHAFALQNGANILRVHDVAQAKECIELFKTYNKYVKQ